MRLLALQVCLERVARTAGREQLVATLLARRRMLDRVVEAPLQRLATLSQLLVERHLRCGVGSRSGAKDEGGGFGAVRATSSLSLTYEEHWTAATPLDERKAHSGSSADLP